MYLDGFKDFENLRFISDYMKKRIELLAGAGMYLLYGKIADYLIDIYGFKETEWRLSEETTGMFVIHGLIMKFNTNIHTSVIQTSKFYALFKALCVV